MAVTNNEPTRVDDHTVAEPVSRKTQDTERDAHATGATGQTMPPL